MSDALKLPPDFVWCDDDTFKHRVSGKRAWVPEWARPTNQAEVNYLVDKIRREYRRDRLFAAVGRNIDRFRVCQIEMRRRGYVM